MKELKLEPLKNVSLEEFSPYGRIIGRFEEMEEYLFHLRPEKPLGVMDLDVTSYAFWDLLPFKEPGRFSMGMIWMKNKPPGTSVEWTECHKTTYEFFFPMGGKELIFVLAPPGDKPDLDKTRAFLVGPDEGVLLDKGTWHYPPFSPAGVTPILMPRYGELAEVTGPTTTALGKTFETPQPLYRLGMLHAMETYYYGENFEDGRFTMNGDYNVRVI